jgi:voltage-gated potassium channel Kch
MTRSDGLVRGLIPWLKRRGFRDLDASGPVAGDAAGGHGHGARILLLGFFRTASSLLEELSLKAPHLLSSVAVVDFNPVVHAHLQARGMKVVYGDISQRDTLAHAGVGAAEVLVCTIPDSLLKGSTNEKLVRQLRELNPAAKIIAPAETLADVARLRAAGADFVSLPRLSEAGDLCEAVRAAHDGVLEQRQAGLEVRLAERKEVLP